MGLELGFGPLQPGAGAVPTPFLVFDALKELGAVYGGKETERLLGLAGDACRKKMGPAVEVVSHVGPNAALQLFNRMVANEIPPGTIHECSLWPAGSAAGNASV